MYSRVARDDAYRRRLMDALAANYRLPLRSIAPATRRFFAETWRLDSVLDQRYFAKLDYSPCSPRPNATPG